MRRHKPAAQEQEPLGVPERRRSARARKRTPSPASLERESGDKENANKRPAGLTALHGAIYERMLGPDPERAGQPLPGTGGQQAESGLPPPPPPQASVQQVVSAQPAPSRATASSAPPPLAAPAAPVDGEQQAPAYSAKPHSGNAVIPYGHSAQGQFSPQGCEMPITVSDTSRSVLPPPQYHMEQPSSIQVSGAQQWAGAGSARRAPLFAQPQRAPMRQHFAPRGLTARCTASQQPWARAPMSLERQALQGAWRQSQQPVQQPAEVSYDAAAAALGVDRRQLEAFLQWSQEPQPEPALGYGYEQAPYGYTHGAQDLANTAALDRLRAVVAGIRTTMVSTVDAISKDFLPVNG